MKNQFGVLSFLLILICGNFAFSQESFEEKKVVSEIKEQEIILKKSDLELNGINTNFLTTNLSQIDLKRLLQVDFDSYRDYDQEKIIQIIDGPQISLYSIQYRIQQGKSYSPEFIESKSNVDLTNITHQTIPLVNVNFGKAEIDILK